MNKLADERAHGELTGTARRKKPQEQIVLLSHREDKSGEGRELAPRKTDDRRDLDWRGLHRSTGMMLISVVLSVCMILYLSTARGLVLYVCMCFAYKGHAMFSGTVCACMQCAFNTTVCVCV